MKEFICPVCGYLEKTEIENGNCPFCFCNKRIEIDVKESIDVMDHFAMHNNKETAAYVMRDTPETLSPVERAYREYFCRKYVFSSSLFDAKAYQVRAEYEVEGKRYNIKEDSATKRISYRNYDYLPSYLPPVGAAERAENQKLAAEESIRKQERQDDMLKAGAIIVFGFGGMIIFGISVLWFILAMSCNDAHLATEALPGFLLLIAIIYGVYKFFTTW